MPEVDDKIKIGCPKCLTKQYVSASKAFSKINCESCQVRFTVPKVFGNIMLHDIVANDEFSSTHSGTHLQKGHNCRVRIFNEKVYESEEVTTALKEQIYRLKEAKAEGLLQLLSYGFVGEEFYIEFLGEDKGSLKSRMQNQKVSQKAALEFSISIAECLMSAHSKNIVIGNMKTSNIRYLKNRQVKLGDCGVTWLVASILSETDSSVEPFNNVLYIAPETIERKIVNKASDIYNFGCIAYELMSKMAPFEEFSSRESILEAHKTKEPVELKLRKPSLPSDVSRMIMKMMNKDASKRPSDLKEIIDCFKSNLVHVEEVKVEEIKREFDNPSPDQTLKPRPPTEIDLDLLSGDSMGSAGSSNEETLFKVEVNNDTQAPKEEAPVIQDINPEVKLQETEVNMEHFDNLSLEQPPSKDPKKMMTTIIVLIILIIIGAGILFSGILGGSGERRQLPINTQPQN